MKFYIVSQFNAGCLMSTNRNLNPSAAIRCYRINGLLYRSQTILFK